MSLVVQKTPAEASTDGVCINNDFLLWLHTTAQPDNTRLVPRRPALLRPVSQQRTRRNHASHSQGVVTTVKSEAAWPHHG